QAALQLRGGIREGAQRRPARRGQRRDRGRHLFQGQVDVPEVTSDIGYPISDVCCRSVSSSGSHTENVDPFPGSLTSVMLPPSARASRREIARPSPVPRALESVRGPALTCSNSSKMRSWSRTGTPIPV